jgi:YD repeat-containing protein
MKIIDPSGKVANMAYDEMKRLKSSESGGDVTAYTYVNSSSTILSRVDYPTFYRVFNYDKMHQIKKIEEFDTNDTCLRSLDYTYDALGRVYSVTDKAGGIRANTYDALGRLIKTVDINGEVTEFKFDVRDNLIELKDPSGGVNAYTYDTTNRIISVTTPAGKVTGYAYGKETISGRNFRTIIETRPSGDRIVSWRNAIGQVEKREFYRKNNDSTLSLEDTYQYAYNSMRNLLSISNNNSSVSFTYDALGRKLSETTNYGTFSKTNSYTYTPNGSLASYTGPDGITYSYIYDAANRLTSIDIPGKGSIVFNSYRWNSPLQMTFPGGAAIHYNYDGLM